MFYDFSIDEIRELRRIVSWYVADLHMRRRTHRGWDHTDARELKRGEELLARVKGTLRAQMAKVPI